MIIYSETCKVTSVATNKTMDADILKFQEGQSLSVALNKSVKLLMSWNGRCFEGKAAGMDFESAGPEIIRTVSRPRG